MVDSFTQKARHLLLLVITIVILGACTPPSDERQSEHVMPAFSRSMQPFCFGRLVIDVPTEADIRVIDQRIQGIGEILVRRNLSKEEFFQFASNKERELAATPHRKEGTVLRDVLNLDNAVILSFRDDDLNTLDYSLLGYFWKNGVGFELGYNAGNDELELIKVELQRAIGLIHPRDNSELPEGPGFCIDNAVVSGSDFRLERVGAAFTVPSLPSMEINVESSSVESIYPENLIQRSDQNLPAIRELHTDLRLEQLRKGKRIVAGFDGLELVEVAKKGTPDELFQATWEFLGEEKSLDRPSVTVSMSYGGERAESTPSGERLSIDEMLGAWEAMLSSLRRQGK